MKISITLTWVVFVAFGIWMVYTGKTNWWIVALIAVSHLDRLNLNLNRR